MPTTRRFGDSLSLSAKGLLLVAIPVIAQVVVLVALRSVQTAVRDAEQWASHSKDVIIRADEIHRVAVQAIASQRGALIVGDADYRDGEPDGKDEALEPLIDRLRTLVADNTAQVGRVGTIRRDAESLTAWIERQRNAVRAGRGEEAIARVRSREGADLMAALRGSVESFLSEEQRIGIERADHLASVTQQSQLLTLLAGVTSLLVACVLAFFFSRGISRRFTIVTRNAERLAAGEPLSPPLRGADEIARLDDVLHDSSRKLAEAAAAAAQSRLEIERRLEELAVLNIELRQQTDENETFIYSVSHDLRSPLVNLQGFSRELSMACTALESIVGDATMPADLRDRIAKILDGEVRESVHYIRTAVSRASTIIDSLLRLARAGRVELRSHQAPVPRIVTQVVDAMRSTIDAKNAEVIVHALEPAWGDAAAVEQIFANLIGNAVNYLDPSRSGVVEIGMEDGSDSAVRRYYVRDNGLGIPELALPKVFTAFQRLHAQHAKGEGVGLALVRRIVDRLRGRIWVESTEGVGSTFFVELPVSAPSTGSTEHVALDPAAPQAAAT